MLLQALAGTESVELVSTYTLAGLYKCAFSLKIISIYFLLIF
jgi:hypothetical protein